MLVYTSSFPYGFGGMSHQEKTQTQKNKTMNTLIVARSSKIADAIKTKLSAETKAFENAPVHIGFKDAYKVVADQHVVSDGLPTNIAKHAKTYTEMAITIDRDSADALPVEALALILKSPQTLTFAPLPFAEMVGRIG